MSTPVILEIGSLALKVHYRSTKTGLLRKARFPWELANEVYSVGLVSERTTRTALETIEELRSRGVEPHNVIAIATGALRDASNKESFLSALRAKLETDVRVITSREEASLLAQGFLNTSPELPALVTDVGGGSVEIVYVSEDRSVLRDSLPIGPIRLDHLGREDPLALLGETSTQTRPWDEDAVRSIVDNELAEASLLFADEVFATGGVVKLVARQLESCTFTLDEIVALSQRVRDEGPPEEIDPDRRAMFLPGLIVLERILVHSKAARMSYVKIPIGRLFLEKLVKRLAASANDDRRRRSLRDMPITSIQSRHSGVFRDPDLETKVIRPEDFDD